MMFQASEYPRWGCFPGFLSPEGACFNDVTPTADLLTLKDMIQDMKRRGNVSTRYTKYERKILIALQSGHES